MLTLPHRPRPPPTPLQETWLGVDLKEAQLAEDQEALSLASELLQKHQNEAADDAAPLK